VCMPIVYLGYIVQILICYFWWSYYHMRWLPLLTPTTLITIHITHDVILKC
jgi:hypothetical protein